MICTLAGLADHLGTDNPAIDECPVLMAIYEHDPHLIAYDP